MLDHTQAPALDQEEDFKPKFVSKAQRAAKASPVPTDANVQNAVVIKVLAAEPEANAAPILLGRLRGTVPCS